MPEKRTIARARRKARAGRRPSTQAGEFVREEIRHVREGRHGARSAKQAIAIGLSKARRAGVKLGPPPGRKKVVRGKFPKSTRRARAVKRALKREPRSAASHYALSRQVHRSAAQRGPRSRRAAALKAVHTKGRAGLQRAARKAARTRKRG
ncbi:MAG TPA: DUF6496 domain-containing protein [Burkholderiales bacterium]|nr:DUF6496 domain-containing protein [Burkholderiales bacterium]